ncbi:hypothetical protein FI667_g14977, partial [Globisporangium splendens]
MALRSASSVDSMSSSRRGLNSHACSDLYTVRILWLRMALFALLTGVAALTAMCLRRCRRCRGPITEASSNTLKGDSSVDNTLSQRKPASPSTHVQMDKWMAYVIGAGIVWTCLVMLGFQSYDHLTTSSSSSLAAARPRVVFSFTTISEGITKIQPTLDALISQDGEGFDTIYVVVPRVYRKTPIEIPSWLVANVDKDLKRSEFHGVTFAVGVSAYHEKVYLIVIDTDFGPASKVLGTLLVEQDPETIIVYGDDDRVYPRQLCDRALHYTAKFPNEAIAVLGGWIAAEDSLYCGRSLEVGVNRVSFVGGAGGVAVKRRFFGIGEATMPAFEIANFSKACFLGDDYYLSHLLSNNGVSRRLVFDSCWNLDTMGTSYLHGGLSWAESTHPGGANVEHYQQCIREFGVDQDLSRDGEFGALFMYAFSHTWGFFRGLQNMLYGRGFVPC